MHGRDKSEAFIFAGLLLSISIPTLGAQVSAEPLNSAATNAQTTAPANYGAIYRRWLDEDVRYIITDQERVDFSKLTTDQQRDKFVTDFWGRRNPSPGLSENKFKEEHYRRIAYTNQHFAARVAGYRTDRGRIYILYGPPKAVDHHYSAAGTEKTGSIVVTSAIPFDWELWHYEYIEGLGKDVTFKFVDTCGCGQYQIPVEKNDLKKYAPR
jgi:GWxTD domain-containing protein